MASEKEKHGVTLTMSSLKIKQMGVPGVAQPAKDSTLSLSGFGLLWVGSLALP